MLEAPIKSMGMQSTELLKLIEEFSKGSETFVLRIIHILTENCKLKFIELNFIFKSLSKSFFKFKAIPSAKLVKKVRELYNKRLPDVRFLIPILTGLTQVDFALKLNIILNKNLRFFF